MEPLDKGRSKWFIGRFEWGVPEAGFVAQVEGSRLVPLIALWYRWHDISREWTTARIEIHLRIIFYIFLDSFSVW